MIQELTNHWRPAREGKGAGFEIFNRNGKGEIDVVKRIVCDRLGAHCKCGGEILRITAYGFSACSKCCAGLKQ